ncbi:MULTISPECIES: S9 family peptidase [unclassified Chitinophaga]|uniref:alpha/beta hydrolase family protein n=1 Tax=unclassified Chitinophaga TaxID=2619133 RepID=UPI0009C865BC|nr:MULTISPECIES: acetylxylan esterase [unclassified Chitinophaga]OMP76471.1 acetylxylan esterase [[Flexibacter] sp. ATCC 35208]WPV66229.1 acetylxylan esterase [Chitinophaga sp. LS1]
MIRLLFCLLLVQCAYAQQNSDSGYKKPLQDVLLDIQHRYGIKIRYTEAEVAGKYVTYADWRYRPDAEATLERVLAPLDLKVRKEKDKQYRLTNYEYYRWPVADGWAELDRIASQYHNEQEWENRKATLQPCILQALQLSPLPPKPASAPIITAERKFDGYTVRNIAIEILPGVYINGSLYAPAKSKGKIPVILNPDGHWKDQRYRPDCQYRCAALARMGAMAFSYDLFAWGESQLQFEEADHRRSLAMSVQALGTIRILDYLLSLKNADTSRVGITGGSGAGSHTVLMTAIDDRIKVSAPVVAISSYFYGGCPCESGMPIHGCGNRTDNVEIAAMAAPRPQLLVSDGGDWTDKMPEHDFPYLQKIYGYYGQTGKVSNVHLPAEGHDFGSNKRKAVYEFMAKYLQLNITAADETKITIEQPAAMYVFGEKGETLPAHAIHGFTQLEKLWNAPR